MGWDALREMAFLNVVLTALVVSHFTLEHLKPISCLLEMINWEDVVELRLFMSLLKVGLAIKLYNSVYADTKLIT